MTCNAFGELVYANEEYRYMVCKAGKHRPARKYMGVLACLRSQACARKCKGKMYLWIERNSPGPARGNLGDGRSTRDTDRFKAAMRVVRRTNGLAGAVF